VSGRSETLVIGLGNIVLSDDGLGVHVVRRLRDRYRWEDRVELTEGGTAGLLLLPQLAEARRAIIVDAIDIGAPAGTLVRLDGEDCASAFSSCVSPHDIGLKDLLGAAWISGAWPRQLVIHGAQPASTSIGVTLTPSVAAAVDLLLRAITAELEAWRVPICHSAPAPGSQRSADA
jgi:hydrogenase maturation protease